jgi:hypothetical protein
MDPELKRMMEGRTNFQLRSIFTATVRPPRTADGRPVCCSYQLRGSCFSNCARRDTHIVLPETELVKLREFTQTNIVDPDIGRPAAST